MAEHGGGMRVLVVGGGIGGMAAAIRFAELGHRVELIDLDQDWRVYGAGITITGPTLRAYRDLGLLDAIKAEGAISTKTRFFRFDGTHIRDMEEPVIEAGLPATGGIMRPILHRIMQSRVRELPINVKLGLTVSALASDSGGVDVTFSDGRQDRFDLVIGADSINSAVRALAFPHMGEPEHTGQGCWRISIKRPPMLETGEFYLGGEHVCGITACASDMVYLWMLTPHVRSKAHFTDTELYDRMKALLAPFGGSPAWIRETMQPSDWINYRPLMAAIQSVPWSNGRIVLIGDAVHATTPHLASGAGMAVESALVLAEEVERAASVDAGLAAYEARRFDRCQDVVETSLAAGRLQLNHGPPQEFAALLEGALARLNAAY